MKKAFTLAEVLITLGVIGVVAALTLPILKQQINYQQYVTSLRKIHSELSQSVQKAMYDKGLEKWADTNIDMGDFLSKYFRISDYASNASAEDFIGNDSAQIKNVDETYSDISGSNSYCAYLNSGASICIKGDNRNVYVDVNGKEGPNIGGRDIFRLWIEDDGNVIGYQGYMTVRGHIAYIPSRDHRFAFVPAAWAGSYWDGSVWREDMGSSSYSSSYSSASYIPSSYESLYSSSYASSASIFSSSSGGSGMTLNNAFSRIVYDGWKMTY